MNMDDRKWDELIDKALREDLALPEGLSERLERRIDTLAQEEKRRGYPWRRYWRYGICAAAACLAAACLILFGNVGSSSPKDTFSDPEEAALVAQEALGFLSKNLNKGFAQAEAAHAKIARINRIVDKHLNNK